MNKIIFFVMSLFFYGCSTPKKTVELALGVPRQVEPTPTTYTENQDYVVGSQTQLAETVPVTAVAVDVYYFSDRKPNRKAPANLQNFTSVRRMEGTLISGKALVSVPASHTQGDLETPILWAKPKIGKNFVLLSSRVADIRSELASRKQDAVLIYVHGFNNSFEDSILRSAQLKYDLQFSGPVIAYTWPSDVEYVRCLQNEEWTLPHLERFLSDFTRSNPKKSVHIIAHSMGAKAISAVLQRQDGKIKNIETLILAAPDIDAQVFREQVAPKISSGAQRTVLYTSNNDKALDVSAELNGYQRAGSSSGQILALQGIETVDTSRVSTFFSLDHSYYAQDPRVLNDIKSVIVDRFEPTRRNLRKVNNGSTSYWELNP